MENIDNVQDKGIDGGKRDLEDYSSHKNLYLYSSEEGSHMLLSNVIHSLANYKTAIPAAPPDGDEEAGGEGGDGKPAAAPQKSANLSTLVGVYLPCIQNIFGVILFIRMAWVVGTAGIVCGFIIVLMCCCTTMLTAISMSAIATNGVVPAGGSYFMISRALGPEFGGAVGILFYIGTTFAGAMYIVGAIEILITYMAPQLSLFGDTTVPENMYNNFRVFGTILLALIACVIYVGVALVNRVSPFALACVLGSIACIYTGIFVNIYGNHDMDMCVLGNRLLQTDGSGNCSKEMGEPLFRTFCGNEYDKEHCDEYFLHHNATLVQGVKGLASGTFWDNLWPSFRELDQIVSRGTAEDEVTVRTTVNNGTTTRSEYNQVIIDITTSFTILVGIFFPSVTGIMAGSNRSGDLADAQLAIPRGTICAIITTSIVYLSSVLLMGGTFDGLLMRDKFGQSVGYRLVIANIAWPNQWVILVGSFAAAIGAGMQSLTGAPRLLQAIAKDGIIPIMDPLAVSSSRGEPTRALILTLAICEFGILLGNVDILAPLLSMFFLMCYGFVNLACGLQTLLRTPNWRPRFHYYHWTLSFLGVFLCLSIMFMASWFNALIAIFIAICIYKYIEFKGAKKEWGDGIRGLSLSAARFSLLRLEEGPPHTKNWRPQILAFVKVSEDYKDKKMLSLVSQLKAGKGLVIAATVLKGDYQKLSGEAVPVKQTLRGWLDAEKVKGFGEVLICPDICLGLATMIQSAGLGGMKPNTVMIGWPSGWRKGGGGYTFIRTLQNVAASKMCLLVPRGLQFFPSAEDRVSGNIDVWWIVHDGGLLMLLPFLLKQHRTWRACHLRIFTVAQEGDNSGQMEKDLTSFLYALRIDAEIRVVEMMTGDISAYAYERTLLMEQRNQMLRELNLSTKRRRSLVETLIETSVKDKLPLIEEGENNGDEEDEEDEENEGGRQVPYADGGEGGGGNGGDGEENDLSSEAQPANIPESEDDVGIEMTVVEPRGKGRGSKKQPQPQQPMAQQSKGVSMKTLRPDEENVRRMHTAVKLNEVIVKMSHDAKLVIVNLPSLPVNGQEDSYMEFLEVLTDNLDRTLLVRGSGREVITIYS